MVAIWPQEEVKKLGAGAEGRHQSGCPRNRRKRRRRREEGRGRRGEGEEEEKEEEESKTMNNKVAITLYL